MSNIDKHIAELSPEEQRTLLAELLQKKLRKPKYFPLSFAQERIWFFSQLMPDGFTYNLPSALRLKGSMNIAALEQSFNEIVRRHDILRATFTTVDGQPVQAIAPTLTVTLKIIDLRELPEIDRENEAHRLIIEDAQQPFDLARGPLQRFTLIQLDETEQVLLITRHHIISDQWSMKVLLKELMALYKAFCAGKPSPLPELPMQYMDFAVWQKQWLQGEVFQNHLSYWKQQLSGAPPLLELPTDRPRPAIETHKGAIKSFILPKPLLEGLKALSQQEGVTLFMTLLAAYKTLLYRYTGQEDILVGIPIANRNRADLEVLIGFFVNTLVMRSNLSGSPSFREVLSRVREAALGAYAHQDLPFERLVEELQPERNLSYNPLFQVSFSLQNTPKVSLDVPGLSLSESYIDFKMAYFDLFMFVSDTEQGKGMLQYNTDLFDAATIERMLEHFQTLLWGIVADPGQQISHLPLLTEAQRHQLLVEWNNTQVDYPKNQCIHHLFEAQVEKTPDAIAVVFEDRQLTYRELNARANQLAHYLRFLGVKPEVLVGICMERSLEMVVGLLGILKAGGAYVPLDPLYPLERLAFMLSDSQVPVLLTQEKLVVRLPESKAKIVHLDVDWEEIAKESENNPSGEVSAPNLAYVIYTSGSTGQPKGAMNTHKGVCNRLLWMQDRYQLTAADRVLQKTPFSFDVSVWEFFWPLMTGACLVVAKPEGHKDSTYLVKLIEEQQITTLHFVPSMLQVFLEEGELEMCNCLKRVICSGEALPLELQERFFARMNAELHNLYGPTEAAIDVTYWDCQQKSDCPTVPIGRPIANTQIYILDSHLQPVPVGVPGELHIGGVGLARGYLNRPDLTAERFIPNPFLKSDEFVGAGLANISSIKQTIKQQNPPLQSSELEENSLIQNSKLRTQNSKLYKTGDLVRYLSDGNIEFIRRIDNQIKIRGFRIELGEIEAALRQHPAVRETAIVVREDEPGNKLLVAYTVLKSQEVAIRDSLGSGSRQIAQLRQFLEEKLPPYMVPSLFVLLEALPLLPNGKLDRRSLPAPEGVARELEVTYVMPRTELERTITEVWQKTLHLEKIGIHDNFFELGGHSLLMLKVNTQLRELLKIDIPILEMFRYPTVASLAEYLSRTNNQIEKFEEINVSTEKLKDGKSRQDKLFQKMRQSDNRKIIDE